MKILFAASECVPFAKAGGLGDVVGALPKALRALGHDVRVVIPRYGSIPTYSLERLSAPLGVPLGTGTAWCGVLTTTLPDSDVPIYFIEHDEVFGGTKIYGGEEGTRWGLARTGVLSRGALELCRYLDFMPDVIHVHDWPTSWIPVMLNTCEQSYFPKTATILTIHNMAYQPRFPVEGLELLELGHEYFRGDGLEDFGQLNPFKGGLYHSTMITTVSPSYSQEIRTPKGGRGLHQVMEFRGADLLGILNGIDTSVWNPATDPYIAENYHAGDLRGKAACKASLQKEMGLKVDSSAPLLGVISRMTEQKGLDVVVETIPGLVAKGAQLAVLGSGDAYLENRFRQLAAEYPGQVGAWMGYNESLAHKIEAGVDLFLMPSRFEPCGLNQMYSQRYGTLPIVHATGGLDDTVDQFDPATGEGTGFKLWNVSPAALENTVSWAMDVFRSHKPLFETMQRRAMGLPLGWDTAADRYLQAYDWAMERKN